MELTETSLDINHTTQNPLQNDWQVQSVYDWPGASPLSGVTDADDFSPN